MKLRIFLNAVVPLFVVTVLVSPLCAQGWGDKMFDRRQISFGSVARLADTTFKLKVKNPYVEEIRISSLTTSCGCISWVDPVPISIPSRGERELTIRLDTVRHFGDKHVRAFATLVEPIKGLTATVTIPVDGRIRDDFEVRPSSVAFGAVDLGKGYQQRINITYNGQSNWQITSAKVTNPYLATQVVERSRAGGTVQYDVIVELKPDAPAGVLRDQLTLKTNEFGNSEVTIPVEARVESDIVVTDAQFGSVAPGTPKSMTVILRGKKPFQIEKVEHVLQHSTAKVVSEDIVQASAPPKSEPQLTTESDAFKIEFTNDLTPIHTLKLSMTPSTGTGMFDEQFSVTIRGRAQPVLFHARGRILDHGITNAAR